MRIVSVAILSVLLWLAMAERSASAPAVPEGFVGPAQCATCHPAQATSHAKSGHARSLQPAGAHPLARQFSRDTVYQREPDFRFRFHLDRGQLRVTGFDRQDRMDIPVQWAFGAGDQAVTLVTRIDANWYLEHYLSFYTALGGMAPTAGHGALKPKTLPEAMGVPYATSDPKTGILGCFECHSTGSVRTDPETGLQPLQPGVQCEACHGAGLDHVAAANRGATVEARRRIGNPKRLSASALNEFCGRCHRPPTAVGASIDWNYSWNLRHQPVYLSQTKCLQNSQGKLSCFTCHEPHQPLEKRASAYNQRCLACHERNGSDPAPRCQTEARSNCIDCHMPRVSPQPALRFTNHWIGIYGEGSRLKPRQTN